jgi:hypothetical protein
VNPVINMIPKVKVDAVADVDVGLPVATETPLRYMVTVLVLCLYVTAI